MEKPRFTTSYNPNNQRTYVEDRHAETVITSFDSRLTAFDFSLTARVLTNKLNKACYEGSDVVWWVEQDGSQKCYYLGGKPSPPPATDHTHTMF